MKARANGDGPDDDCSSGKMIVIRYASNETGWAERLDENRARIANVPYVSGLNIDDVVELHPDQRDGYPIAGAVLVNVFPRKTALNYPTPYRQNFKKMAEALHAMGCRAEGVVEGLCIVAHGVACDPLSVAKEAGINASLFEVQP
jgi:hypothetical protein